MERFRLDVAQTCSTSQKEINGQRRIVIIEGFLIFDSTALHACAEQLDLKYGRKVCFDRRIITHTCMHASNRYFLTLDFDTCRVRRKKRTDYQPPDPTEYFVSVLASAKLQYTSRK